MDQVDRLSINGLPLESKTPAQAREELLREIRIPAAIQVSLYVFAACYSSIFLPQPSQPQSFLWGDLYACIVDCFLQYNWVSVEIWLDEGIDYVWIQSAAYFNIIFAVFLLCTGLTRREESAARLVSSLPEKNIPLFQCCCLLNVIISMIVCELTFFC